MAEATFSSPILRSLSNLLRNPDFAILQQLYDAEEKNLIKELIAADGSDALHIIKGKAKMLKKVRNLPETIIERQREATK